MSYQDKIDQAHWEEHDRNGFDYRTDYCPRECVADASRGFVGQIAQVWGFVLTDQERDLVRLAYGGYPTDKFGPAELDIDIIDLLNDSGRVMDVGEIADTIERATEIYWDGDVFRPMPCPLMSEQS